MKTLLRHPKIAIILRVALFLCALQIVRIALVFGFFASAPYSHDIINGSTLLLLLGLLFFAFRPNKHTLALDFSDVKHTKEGLYVVASGVVIFLAMTCPLFSSNWQDKDTIFLLYSVAVVPIFEELLFRGGIWSELSACFSQKQVWVITSILFGLWHLGYAPDIAHTMSENQMGALTIS